MKTNYQILRSNSCVTKYSHNLKFQIGNTFIINVKVIHIFFDFAISCVWFKKKTKTILNLQIIVKIIDKWLDKSAIEFINEKLTIENQTHFFSEIVSFIRRLSQSSLENSLRSKFFIFSFVQRFMKLQLKNYYIII